MRRFVESAARQNRDDPRENLIAALAAVTADSDRLSELELDASHFDPTGVGCGARLRGESGGGRFQRNDSRSTFRNLRTDLLFTKANSGTATTDGESRYLRMLWPAWLPPGSLHRHARVYRRRL